jgi:hypothetical protein
MKVLRFLPIFGLLVACNPPHKDDSRLATEKAPEEYEDFNAYWKKGGAEIASYELEQARYGEIHKGTATTVFVTEPFSKSKQVKLDNYKEAGEDRVNVLKLNMTKKFLTGIYPYSMMLSTFTPLDGSAMIKSTMTVQEWCGHTFMQFNKTDSGYNWTGFSYFESEGDNSGQLLDVISEDEIWTQIRLDPNQLKEGEIDLLPGSFFLRLRHQEVATQKTMATKYELEKSDFAEEPHSAYSLDYGNRKLTIYFESAIPNRILGWEETHMSGFGDAVELTTRAKRINSIRSKYWGKNKNVDRTLREQLGLSME